MSLKKKSMDRPSCKICGMPARRHNRHTKTGVVQSWENICNACANKKQALRRGFKYPGGTAGRQAIKYKMGLVCCELCAWKGHCDVHHKDGNRQNAQRNNLIVVCPNCHRNIHHPLLTTN